MIPLWVALATVGIIGALAYVLAKHNTKLQGKLSAALCERDILDCSWKSSQAQFLRLSASFEHATKERDDLEKRLFDLTQEHRICGMRQAPSRSAGSDLERFEQVLAASKSFSKLVYVLGNIESNTDGILKLIDRKLIAKPRRASKKT